MLTCLKCVAQTYVREWVCEIVCRNLGACAPCAVYVYTYVLPTVRVASQGDTAHRALTARVLCSCAVTARDNFAEKMDVVSGKILTCKQQR